MMQIAMRFCRDKDDAEDIVQEVMLRLWIRREELGHNVTALACKRYTESVCQLVAQEASETFCSAYG